MTLSGPNQNHSEIFQCGPQGMETLIQNYTFRTTVSSIFKMVLVSLQQTFQKCPDRSRNVPSCCPSD